MIQIIPPDDLKPGLIVTVLQGPRLFSLGNQEGDSGTLTITECRDHSYAGEVLEILAVNHPFVVLRNKRWKPESFSGKPFFLDTRLWELMILSEDYIRAILGDVQE